MFWKKFLSRKFLLAVVTLIAALVNPDAIASLPWPVVGVVLAYIFGEGGRDILRLFVDYKNNKNNKNNK